MKHTIIAILFTTFTANALASASARSTSGLHFMYGIMAPSLTKSETIFSDKIGEYFLPETFSVDHISVAHTFGIGFDEVTPLTSHQDIIIGLTNWLTTPSKISGLYYFNQSTSPSANYQYNIRSAQYILSVGTRYKISPKVAIGGNLGLGVSILNGYDFSATRLPDSHLTTLPAFSNTLSYLYTNQLNLSLSYALMKHLTLSINYQYSYLGNAQLTRESGSSKSELPIGYLHYNTIFAGLNWYPI